MQYKISCPNLADFKYTSLVYQKYNCRVFLQKKIFDPMLIFVRLPTDKRNDQSIILMVGLFER